MLGYDKYIVAFSGGKDSTAIFLHLLESGVDRSKIELWHHDIDGKDTTMMDWKCTPAYCRAFAKAFNVPIYFSWKEGGFRREMMRNNAPTSPTWFEVPGEEWIDSKLHKKEDSDGLFLRTGGKGPLGTRLKFPQVSPDLSVRWCSAYLKIMIMESGIRNQRRFDNQRVLVLSGERGEESKARSKYAIHESDRSDNRDGKAGRLVDRCRPIRDWSEQQVWEIIERWKVRAHPAYYLGFGRVSCMYCIFGNANQMATAYFLAPDQGEEVISHERDFGVTIKRNDDMLSLINKGNIYPATLDAVKTKSGLNHLAVSDEYTLDIFMEQWELPAGAYGENCGPL